jgi:hypothetical protein
MKTIAALGLCFAFSSSFAHELTDEFSDMISVSSTAGDIVVEYCPDNTCEVFTAPRPADIREIEDFAYVYLFTKSTYSNLQEFRQRGRSGRVGAVLDRYSAGCQQIQAQEAARCVLSRLAAKYEIRVEFVRYDEGGRHIGFVEVY